MKYIYETDNLVIFEPDSLHNRDGGGQLWDDREEESIDIIEELYWQITGNFRIPEDGVPFGRARITIEFPDPEEAHVAKEEFFAVSFPEWGIAKPERVYSDNRDWSDQD